MAATVLSGCWTQVGFGPAHRNHNDAEDDLTQANVAALTEVWSVDIPGTASEPMVSDGRVFVTRAGPGTVGIGVRALDLGTGATVWDQALSVSNNLFAYGTPAAISGGEVHAGSAAMFQVGSLIRCAATQTVLEKDGTGSVLGSSDVVSPVVTSGSLRLQTTRQFAGGVPSCSAGGPMNLTVSNLDSPGSGGWTAAVPGTPPGPAAPITALPTVGDGRVYVASGTTLSAYALDGCGSAVCEALWSVDLPGTAGITPVAGVNGDVFLATSSGDAVSIDGATGTELWRTETTVGSSPARLALADGVLVVAETHDGSNGNVMRAFDAAGCGAATCGPLWWAAPPPTVITSAPVVAGGVVYLGLRDNVVAYPADCAEFTCPALVRLPFAGDAVALSVAQGQLFVAGTGQVAAYAPPPPS